MLTLSFFFPAFSIPFLISKMQIIGKNHLLSRFCCCCHHQPQRCSQPCAPLTREGACRGPQTPSCVPSSLWVAGQLHQNHRTHSRGTAGDRRTHSKPSLVLIGPPKGCGCFMNCVRSYQGRGASPGVSQVLRCPKSRIPSQAMCLSLGLCVFITQVLHISGYKLHKCVIKCFRSPKKKDVYAAVEHRNFSLMAHL